LKAREEQMAKCEKCGRETEKIYSYDDYDCLCWWCMKPMQLKDERDWEDDPITDDESEE
jgi:hypothetical protein